MLTNIEKILFLLLVFVSGYAAFLTFRMMFRSIGRGQGEIARDNPWQRIKALVVGTISQGGIIHRRRVASLFHYGVAWGFIFYMLVNLIDIIEGLISGFAFPGDNAFGDIYRLLADLFSVAVLVGVTYFLLRRFATRDAVLSVHDNVKLDPKAISGIPRDSLIVGVFILLHVGFRFLGQTFLLAIEGADSWQPFANLISNLWSDLSPAALDVGWHICWWVALGLILAFIPYFPYSKHAHLFMGPFNIATRPKRKALGALDALDFEDESIEQFGAARLTDLSQTQILDAFACIMCNRCQDACPAYVTGKELSPAALEINKRYYLKANMGELASGQVEEALLLDYGISESAVWACTTCGACVEVCPVGNEPMFDILNVRQNQVLMESTFPHELRGAFNGMERLANPWGMTEDRMAWTATLDFDVPTVQENPNFDILYWVGCAGAFDPSAQEIARAMATLLHSAGVNFAVLGNDETCTGDSARRAGNEYLFYEMAMMNIETLKGVGADKKPIVATCPHCLHTIGREYADLDGQFEVIHHTRLINELIAEGKLSLNQKQVSEQTTFHDPCYLGRHIGEFDAPREVLRVSGSNPLEMNRSRENSFCCGAGGAQMWKEEEHGERTVSMDRFKEARATGASILATGCPFCAIMLKDANTEAGDVMEVRDIAQVVADALS
ncbi:MAG: (Fe-S)-binding protein [Candidatus Promineifilaceae bacterium]